jgi:hypothetical protein
MWIVTVYDSERDEEVDVIAHDLDEMIKILNYVKNNEDQLFLNHVEERWLSCGLDGLKEIVEDKDQDQDSNDIPDKF